MKCRPNSILLLTQSRVSKFKSLDHLDPIRPVGRVKNRATLITVTVKAAQHWATFPTAVTSDVVLRLGWP